MDGFAIVRVAQALSSRQQSTQPPLCPATQLASVLPAASMTVGSINGSIMRRAGSSKYDPLLRGIDDGLVDG